MPSGAYWGLECRTFPRISGVSTFPPATSMNEMRSSLYDSFSKSVSGPRSDTNAIVRPSGDQSGMKSPYLSFVSWRTVFDSRSNR